MSRRNRKAKYQEIEKRAKREAEWWIKSDPRGYISAASNLNKANPDFRRVTKFIKRWKHNAKTDDERFALKSFHVEQAVVALFVKSPQSDFTEVLFRFLCGIPQLIANPQIRDRADQNKFIDDYVKGVKRRSEEDNS